MRMFYQVEWFGIKFTSIYKPSRKKLATREFYEKFYNEFYRRHDSYQDIDIKWRRLKELIVNDIKKLAKDKDKVLSVGCGIGYIESQLSNEHKFTNITAIEPSIENSRWLNSSSKVTFLNGFFPEVLINNEQFDFAYISYIDYLFNDEEYLTFIKSIIKYPIKHFVFYGLSVYTASPKENLKHKLRSVLSFLKGDKEQLWGYQRTIEEHDQILKKAGIKSIQFRELGTNNYCVSCKM